MMRVLTNFEYNRSLRMVRDELRVLSNLNDINEDVLKKALHLAKLSLEKNPLLDPKTLAISCLFIVLRDKGLLTPNLIQSVLNGSSVGLSWISLSRVIEVWRDEKLSEI